MDFLYYLIAFVLGFKRITRAPKIGERVRYVQPGYRNAYDGYEGVVDNVATGALGTYGFSIDSGTSSLHCYGKQQSRHLYQLSGSNQVYAW